LGRELSELRNKSPEHFVDERSLADLHASPERAATRTIPIIFTNLSDPVGTGVVASIARPGGNATGFSAYENSIAGKWLEMLREIAPAARRVAVLSNPETAACADCYLSFIGAAASTFGVAATAVSVRTVGEMDAAVAAHAREPGGALIVLPDSFADGACPRRRGDRMTQLNLGTRAVQSMLCPHAIENPLAARRKNPPCLPF
jgi:hypothetical protein